MRLFMNAAAALLLSSISTAASADEVGESASQGVAPDAYGDAIRQAVAEFEAGNWPEARALFRRAHELSPNARTWRGLGITAFELRRYVDAIAELEAAQADPRKPLTAEQRKQAGELIQRARAFVSVFRIRVTPPDAEVIVDGRPAELRDSQLYLDPGAHSVVVRKPGYRELREAVSAEAGTSDELSIALSVAEPEDEGASVAGAPRGAQEVASAPMAPRKRVWTWVLAGASLGAGGAAVGLALATTEKHDEFTGCSGSECATLRDEGQRLQLLTNVSFGVSGALLGGALLAYFLEGRSVEEPQRALVLHPRGVALRTRF